MPKITTIYTRKGDDGTTALGTNQRVPKDSLRITAYGTVDELNSQVGMALAYDLQPILRERLKLVQNQLFHLGSDLAYPPEDESQVPRIEERHVKGLEDWIDEMNKELGQLENFILPGGNLGGAALQVARAVCRRAERDCVALAREEKVNPQSIAYINRLSDLLFEMGRYQNMKEGVEETLWDSRA